MTAEEIRRQYWALEAEQHKAGATKRRIDMACLAMERFLTFVYMEAYAVKLAGVFTNGETLCRAHALSLVITDRKHFTVEFP